MSADNFITTMPWAIDLCRRIGLDDQLIPTDASRRQAFVVHNSQLRKVPEGFLLMAPSRLWPIVATPILSWRGKMRLAWEYFVPRRRKAEDESLASFATRRLGRETFERLVQPLIGGIYTADPEKLSLAATLPRFLEMEQQHGSLVRAALYNAKRRRKREAEENRDRGSSGARYSMFVAPREGMSSLVDAIAQRLPQAAARLNTEVTGLAPAESGGWTLRLRRGNADETLHAGAVIVATPVHRAASLLQPIDAPLADDLGRIPQAGCSIVSLAFARGQISHALDGFGFVVPAVERRRILSASFSSVKYPGRAPDDAVLIRTFVGGACQSELADLPDDALRDLVTGELSELLGITGEPMLCRITRWPHAMPQYHLGHRELVARIEQRTATHSGLALAGNAYQGVGVPYCIHSGEQAAERVLGRDSS